MERLTEEAIWSSLRYAARKAGIRKSVHPHMLRHTRLTDLATEMTEQELKVFAGWTQDSSMASVYVYLSGRDAEKALLRVYGIKGYEEGERRAQPLKPSTCPNCGYVNPREAKFCLKCGYPLTSEAVKEVEKLSESVDELIDALLSDPKTRELLARKLARNAH